MVPRLIGFAMRHMECLLMDGAFGKNIQAHDPLLSISNLGHNRCLADELVGIGVFILRGRHMQYTMDKRSNMQFIHSLYDSLLSQFQWFQRQQRRLWWHCLPWLALGFALTLSCQSGSRDCWPTVTATRCRANCDALHAYWQEARCCDHSSVNGSKRIRYDFLAFCCHWSRSKI